MFEEWGFLLTEIWVLLALAALVGLVAGWIIWGGRAEAADTVVTDRLRADLESCRKRLAEKDARIATLEDATPPAAPSAKPAPEAPVPVADSDDRMSETTAAGVKPATLDTPRDGIADDLKKIKGIGPKLEKLCNSLGFWHYEQIAAWTDEEVAWVDANLEGFKGRVTRDGWVAQAAVLAKGGTIAFSKRVDKGDEY
ncbi:MAG: hypothetical protein KJP02_03835 [Octadecabacter sp.]|nr:hypothetical protein [Octadecabacter sp.]